MTIIHVHLFHVNYELLHIASICNLISTLATNYSYMLYDRKPKTKKFELVAEAIIEVKYTTQMLVTFQFISFHFILLSLIVGYMPNTTCEVVIKYLKRSTEIYGVGLFSIELTDFL